MRCNAKILMNNISLLKKYESACWTIDENQFRRTKRLHTGIDLILALLPATLQLRILFALCSSNVWVGRFGVVPVHVAFT